MLGVKVSTMNFETKPWTICIDLVCLAELKGTHGAEYVCSAITDSLKPFKLSLENIVATTSDTTASAVKVNDCINSAKESNYHDASHSNVYNEEVQDSTTLPCVSHLLQLFISRSVNGEVPKSGKKLAYEALEGADKAKNVLEAMNEIGTHFRASEQRMNLLHEKCVELDIPKRTFVADSSTRWNVKQYVAARYKQLRTAVDECDDNELFKNVDKKTEKIKKLKEKKRLITAGMPILDEILPMMTRVAQWTQVLTRTVSPTISLVLHMLADLRLQIASLKDKATLLSRTTGTAPVQRNLVAHGIALLQYCTCFSANYDLKFKPLENAGVYHAGSLLHPGVAASFLSKRSSSPLCPTVARVYMERFLDGRYTSADDDEDEDGGNPFGGHTSMTNRSRSRNVVGDSHFQREVDAYVLFLRTKVTLLLIKRISQMY